jgi:hypothetical protein
MLLFHLDYDAYFCGDRRLQGTLMKERWKQKVARRDASNA